MENVTKTVLPTCKYCNKSFRKLSTLSAHLCEPKRRFQQKNETGVQLGYQAFLQFFVATQGSAKLKTYDDDFVSSPYYSSFVKFGQYLVQIRAINIPGFLDHLLKNNCKLDNWTKDIYYNEFLHAYLRKEHPQTALERTFTEMQKWADESGKQFNNIFREGAANKICNMIVNGRISPWVLYNCSSGMEFLSTLNEEQISLIFKSIDPDYWLRKFLDYVADTLNLKDILSQAGL